MNDSLNMEYVCKCKNLEQMISPEAKKLFYEIEYIRDQIYLNTIEQQNEKPDYIKL